MIIIILIFPTSKIVGEKKKVSGLVRYVRLSFYAEKRGWQVRGREWSEAKCSNCCLEMQDTCAVACPFPVSPLATHAYTSHLFRRCVGFHFLPSTWLNLVAETAECWSNVLPLGWAILCSLVELKTFLLLPHHISGAIAVKSRGERPLPL